jgi:caa(3)-type oxidase subunit IV
MAHDHSHGEHASMHPQELVEHEIAPTAKSLTIFAVLAGMALLALFIGFSDLGPMKVVASLMVAAVQASVLAFFFMDLKQADKLTWLVALSGVFWTFLMFLFVLTDYLTRHLGVL